MSIPTDSSVGGRGRVLSPDISIRDTLQETEPKVENQAFIKRAKM